jgi:DNA-binding GntR family transcriptional regulator
MSELEWKPQRNSAKLFQVNRSTIVIALEELAADGLIESKVGSGTKVINNTWSLKEVYLYVKRLVHI